MAKSADVSKGETTFPDGDLAIHTKALVRMVFYFGALVSTLDAVFTYCAIRLTGTWLEGNTLMRVPMEKIGVVSVCVLRALIGILVFWLFTLHIKGKRFFLTKRTRNRYYARRKRLIEDHQTLIRRIRFRFISAAPYRIAFEAMLALVLTSAVVGNDIRAYIQVVMAHGHV